MEMLKIEFTRQELYLVLESLEKHERNAKQNNGHWMVIEALEKLNEKLSRILDDTQE